jgi:tetratricopeptide (TPR) repeat protein
MALGDYDRAHDLAFEAEGLARAFSFNASPENRDQTRAWISLAEAMVAMGEFDHAVDFVHDIHSEEQLDHVRVGTAAVVALAASSANDRALGLTSGIEARIPTLRYPRDQAQCLAGLAAAVRDCGDRDCAASLLAKAEAVARGIAEAQSRVPALAEVANVSAALGDHERARQLIADAEPHVNDLYPLYRTSGWADLAEAAIAAGDQQHAEAIADMVSLPDGQAWVLAKLALWAADHGEGDLAHRLAGDAETRVRTMPALGHRLTVMM